MIMFSLRKLVNHNEDGFLVNQKDLPDLEMKLEKIMSLPAEERQAMGLHGHEKVASKYTWEIAANKLEKLYRECVQ